MVDNLNEFGDGFGFDKDFVLKSALILTDRPDIGFNADNFDKENTEAIEAGWERAVRDPLMCAAQLAASFGYHDKTLTSANVLIPVAYYLKRLDSPSDFHVHPKYASDRLRLRKWLVIGLLKSVFSAKTDTLLAAVRTAIESAPSAGGFPLEAIERVLVTHGKSLKFDDDELEMLLNSEYSRRDTFSVLAALYPSLNTQFKFHIDHIFPKSGFYKVKLRQAGLSGELIDKYQGMFNQLPNLQLLEGVANQAKLDAPFEEWVRPLRSAPSLDGWNQYRGRHFVPELGAYSLHDFDEFFNKRREMIREQLKRELSFASQ